MASPTTAWGTPSFPGRAARTTGSDRDVCGQRPRITEAPGTCPVCLETQLSTGDSVTAPQEGAGSPQSPYAVRHIHKYTKEI